MLPVLLLSILYFSCDYTIKKSTTTTGAVTVGVDEGISPVIKKEADEFMRLNTESKITLQTETTNEAIADLINGKTKMIVPINRHVKVPMPPNITTG